MGSTDKDFELQVKTCKNRNQLKITNDLLDKYKEYRNWCERKQ